MKKLAKVLLGLGLVALLGGVARYLFVGAYNYTSDVVASEVYHGSISILGSNSHITVQSGSQVDVLTITGQDNTVIIEPGAEVAAIRGAGGNNSVVAPNAAAIDTTLLMGTTVTGAGGGPTAIPEPGNLDGL